jgi:hypothetical protein
MPTSKFEKFLPMSGVLAGILFAIASFLPVIDEKVGNPERALATWQGHEARNVIGGIAAAYLAVVLVFFASGVRQALRSREPEESTYSSVAYAGGVLLAGAFAIQAMLMFAGADAAAQDDAAAMNVLTYVGGASWIPWAVGSAAFLVATGLGGLRTGALPKWLAIVTLVLGVGNLLGPTGILVYLAYPVWLVVAGAVLTARSGATTHSPTYA